MSQYDELKKNGLSRGRPRLSDEEREKRKRLNAVRQEARRRANIVLQHRHAKEYEEIFAAELNTLLSEITS
jgi:hypothetical protein